MKKISLYVMAVFYFCAGINHFWHPLDYVKIVPTFIPYHLMMVYISGVCEMICGVLLFIPSTRRIGAWLTIVLLIAVFPANLQMALNYYNENNPELWIVIVRLPVQILLILWAWLYTKNEKLN